MITRDPRSNLFVAMCGECGLREHIDSDSGFGAASLAAGAGWLLSVTGKDLCRACCESVSAPARRRAKIA